MKIAQSAKQIEAIAARSDIAMWRANIPRIGKLSTTAIVVVRSTLGNPVANGIRPNQLCRNPASAFIGGYATAVHWRVQQPLGWPSSEIFVSPNLLILAAI
ncbi:MAG: hypothetical protein JWR22_948 [Herminiimonas sp.]|nr:hypothetical protein [Herminiimonas sp.]